MALEITDTTYMFEIHLGSDGKYCAVRTKNPSFCMVADTVEQAAKLGKGALDFYITSKTQLPREHE
jgi:predicted RNase H-like HicB family nuclease